MKTPPPFLAASTGFALLVIAAVAYGQGNPPAQKPQPVLAPTAPDVSRLLTKEEVAAVQGSAITDAQSKVNGEGQFRVTQCFYSAEDSIKSVSVMLTQPNPGGAAVTTPAAGKARTVKQFWHDTFDRFANKQGGEDKDAAAKDRGKEKEKEKDKARDNEKEEDDEKPPPRRIDGLGDDAYWTRSHVGGALYVLKGETLLRISVGGPDNEEARLAKSKTLAAKALARL